MDFTQSDKANLSQIRAAQVWPRLRYGLVEYMDHGIVDRLLLVITVRTDLVIIDFSQDVKCN